MYLLGKNLLAILNNIWHSFHVNRNTLRFLKVYEKHESKLVNQSYGFYYNIMSCIHKHNIVVTEILVICTVCLAEYGPKLTQFFIFLQANILFYFFIVSTVTLIFYRFRHLRESYKLSVVYDEGFAFFFITVFFFVFYRVFVKSDVTVVVHN